jgi:hypothetical protein
VYLIRLHHILPGFWIWPTFQGHRGQSWYDTLRTASNRPTIHTCIANPALRGSYCISSGSTVRYEPRECWLCQLRYFIYDLRDFLLRPEVFHDTIRGSYGISLGRNQIVLQILTSLPDHYPITPRSGHDTIWYLWNWLYGIKWQSVWCCSLELKTLYRQSMWFGSQSC